MNIPTKQNQGHREETGDWQGEGGEGWTGSLGFPGCINSKVLLYSTGNYIQYPMINIMEKNMKRMCMCVYIYACITESLCCTAVTNTTL